MQYFSTQYIQDSLWFTVLSIVQSFILILYPFPGMEFQNRTFSPETIFVFSGKVTIRVFLSDIFFRKSYLPPPYQWLG